jgi:hypothetical protein
LVSVRFKNSSSASLEFEKKIKFFFESFFENISGESNKDFSAKIKLYVFWDKKFVEPRNMLSIKTKLCKNFFGLKNKICVFDDSHLLRIRKNNNSFKSLLLFKPDEKSFEFVTNLIISLLGESLDRRGFHRIHGIGHCRPQTHYAQVFPRNSNFGKSTFCFKLLEHRNDLIFGDEIVITDGFRIFPFPIPISLKNKSQLSSAKKFNYQETNKVFWGYRILVQIPNSRISHSVENFKISFQSTFSQNCYVISFSLGLGYLQMKEFMIRFDNIFDLVKIFFSRLRVFSKLKVKFQIQDFN